MVRHIVTHVREVLAGQEPPANRIAQPGAGWHDRGDGTAAIMCGTELVASFNAQFLVPDEFPTDPPPDRTEETSGAWKKVPRPYIPTRKVASSW